MVRLTCRTTWRSRGKIGVWMGVSTNKFGRSALPAILLRKISLITDE